MPAAVVVAVGFLAEYGVISAATAFAIGSFAATYGAAILFVGALAYSASEARKAKSRATDQYNAAQVDRMASVSSSVAPRELVLGRVRKGGAVFFKASTGSQNRDLYLAIALAGHEIDAVEGIYLNDQLVALDANGFVTTAPYTTSTTLSGTVQTDAAGNGTVPATAYGLDAQFADVNNRGNMSPCGVSLLGTTVTTTRPYAYVNYQYTVYGSNVQITTHLGAAGQVANAALVAAFGSAWPSTHTVQGVAYLVAKLTYSETAFPSGIPAITAIIRGAKVYDPRTGITAWSKNPALLMRHVYQHAKFGKAAVSALEDARIIAAANACDTSTVYTVGGVAQAARALYQADITAPFGTPARSLLDDLAQAMGGSWAFAGGELYLKPGTYTAPVMTLTDADLAVVKRDGASETQSPIKISTHRERASKFNTVKVTIWDQAQDYKQATLSPLVGSALLDRDGAELVQEVTYPAIGYAPQALHVAGVMMRDARDPLTVELPFKLSAYPLELFDTVALTLSRYGWVGKTFMVLSRSFSSDGSLVLSMKETSAAIVTMDAGFAAQGFAANTNLPKPWQIASVGALTVTSGTSELLEQADGTVVSRIRVAWAQVPDQAVVQNGQVEVQYRRVDSSGAWSSLVVAGNETAAVTSDVLDGMGYIVRARAKTTLAIGDWGTQVSHIVVGKIAAPSAPTGLVVTGQQISFTGIADADLEGYLVRAASGANPQWVAGTPLHTGVVTTIPFTPQVRLYGLQTIMVAALDTTGNMGEFIWALYDFSQPSTGNTLYSTDYAASNFPGSITGGTASGGVLAATVATVADLYVLGDLYSQASLYAATYSAVQWVSTVFTPTYNGTVTLVSNFTGNAVVEYQIDGGTGNDAYALADDYASADLYGANSTWLLWPGSMDVKRGQGIVFRVSIAAGTAFGSCTAFSVYFSMPLVRQTWNAQPIAVNGSRLSPAAGSPSYSNWVQVKTVQVTPVADGSGAVSAQVLDMQPFVGPALQLLNSSGVSVAGTATIDIGGFIDV
jgi:Putative phage tail protein